MKTYSHEPANFCDLEPNLILTEKDIINEMLLAKTVFFYDTCSIIHHAKLRDKTPIISYIKKYEGVIVLTRTVIIELASSDNGNKILPGHLRYLQSLNQNGIKIVLFDEELCYGCLDATYTDNIENFNKLLCYSVLQVKKYQGIVSRFFNALPEEDRKKLSGSIQSKKEEFSGFFQAIRLTKSSNDSMAEELLFMCLILLQGCIGRVVLLSNDIHASDKFLRTIRYIDDHYKRKNMFMYTTAVFCHKLYNDSLLPIDELTEFLSSTYIQGQNIQVYATTKEDIEITHKKISMSDLAVLISTDKELRIYR